MAEQSSHSFHKRPEDVLYLQIEDIFRVYAAVFRCTSLQAEDQLRGGGRAILESALARPRNHALYQSADLPGQAAALAHAIAEGQPFIEGNKRTALAALRTFLRINQFGISASQRERFEWIRQLSEGPSMHWLRAFVPHSFPYHRQVIGSLIY